MCKSSSQKRTIYTGVLVQARGVTIKVRFAWQLQLLSEEWKKSISTSMYGALKNTSSITLQAFRQSRSVHFTGSHMVYTVLSSAV